MTRIMRALALTAILAFAIVGCAQPLKRTEAKNGPPKKVAAKEPREPGTTATRPSAVPTTKPEQPEATKPTTAAPTKLGRKTPPPPPEPPVTKEIDAAKVGIPIYPGAQVSHARELTWPKSQRGRLRSASLTSTDDPDKIIKWYQAKLGAKAQSHRRDTNGRKLAWFYLSDPKTRVVKSASISWTEETSGEPRAVRVHLTVREPPSKPGR